jgi:hypothetical protein
MQKEDSLHSLVFSLTASEKRYISLFISRHVQKEQNYQLKLFEGLASLKEYDEEKLIHRLANPSLVRHLASEKSQLFGSILLAMRVYHEERTVDTRIRALMTDAEFLLERRQYGSSIDLLKKARIIAVKHERRLQLLEILQLEAKIIKEKKSTQLDSGMSDNHQLQNTTLHLLLEESQLVMLRNSVFSATRQLFHTHSGFGELQVPGWVDEPAVVIEEKGFNYNFNRLSVIALYHSRKGQHIRASEAYGLLIQLWEDYPHRHDSERLAYKKMLSNSIVVNQLLQRNTEVINLIEKLKKHPCRNAEEEAEQFQTTAFAELMLLMNSGEWVKLEKLVRKIEDGLNVYKTKINKARELAFRFNIGMCWFVLGNYKASMVWMNQIIEMEKTDHRRDIQHLARLFRLILLFELDKHDLLEYELINTERYLRQRKAWAAWEASIVRLIKKLLETEIDKQRGLFEKFLHNSSGSAKLHDVSFQGSSEISLWAQSHLLNQPIRNLIVESH